VRKCLRDFRSEDNAEEYCNAVDSANVNSNINCVPEIDRRKEVVVVDRDSVQDIGHYKRERVKMDEPKEEKKTKVSKTEEKGLLKERRLSSQHLKSSFKCRHCNRGFLTESRCELHVSDGCAEKQAQRPKKKKERSAKYIVGARDEKERQRKFLEKSRIPLVSVVLRCVDGIPDVGVTLEEVDDEFVVVSMDSEKLLYMCGLIGIGYTLVSVCGVAPHSIDGGLRKLTKTDDKEGHTLEFRRPPPQ